jgi:hypothetical protein
VGVLSADTRERDGNRSKETRKAEGLATLSLTLSPDCSRTQFRFGALIMGCAVALTAMCCCASSHCNPPPTRILHSKAAAVPLGCCLVRPLHLQSLGHSRNRCCFILYFVSLPPSHHSCVCMCSFHTFVLLLFCSCRMIACSAP